MSVFRLASPYRRTVPAQSERDVRSATGIRGPVRPRDGSNPGVPVLRTEHDHGSLCGCLLLAAAVGGGREAVDFTYCINVLQKHWQLECNHGERCAMPATGSRADRWQGSGSLDGVKAILVREA